METRREQRLQKLVDEIKQHGRIHLHHAAELLAVSGMTIRRDLSQAPQSLLLLGDILSVPVIMALNTILLLIRKVSRSQKNSILPA